jgi:hypothetical protein
MVGRKVMHLSGTSVIFPVHSSQLIQLILKIIAEAAVEGRVMSLPMVLTIIPLLIMMLEPMVCHTIILSMAIMMLLST